MAQRKEYRSALRSRRMIRQAFQELLREKEFDKITVTDIVNRADLNRSTFYAHYPDIYGIVEEMQEEIVCRNMTLFQQIQYRDILRDPLPYLQSIAATLEENQQLFQTLGRTIQVRPQLDQYLVMMAQDIMTHSDIPDAVRSSPYFPIRVHFFLGGILNAYQQWAEGNIPCSLEDITRDIGRIIQQSATGFLDTDWMQELQKSNNPGLL